MSGKKSTSTSKIQYDPFGLSQYQQNIGTTMPVLRDFATNPYGNPFFQQNLGMLNKQASQAGARGMQNIFANAKQMNLSPGALSPFLASEVAKQGMRTSGLQQQGRFSAMQQAMNTQLNSLAQLNAFQPLLTGQTTSEQQSGGLLSQILGGALAAAPFLFPAAGPASVAAGAAGPNVAAGGGIGSVGLGPTATPTFNSGGFWNPASYVPNYPAINPLTPPFNPYAGGY